MKKVALIAFLFNCMLVCAQNRANVWELSYSDTLAFPNCEMKYVNGTMDTNLIYRVMSIYLTNSSICDTSGNLLFYSNGLTIGNKNYDTLQNAVNFNPGWSTNSYEPGGMGINQGVLILPFPNFPYKYFIFSLSGELLQNDIQPIHLSYSVIDMNLDGGLGGIVDTLKNKYAIDDTLCNGGLTAVKHANGRDWWVIVPEYYSNRFYKLLLTPNGIENLYYQNIGLITTQDIIVQATFAPDGSKYCFSNAGGSFIYMKFDRCSGEFSNSTTIFSSDSLGFIGCSFSSNSRYLYVNTQYDLFQYDTWNSNISDNVIHVATWDSFVHPVYHIPILFGIQQLAPDGKIYVSGWNGTEYLNVINEPDSLGLGCNFGPHSYILPQYNNSVPTFPNYDLESLLSSACDTLFTLAPSKNVEANSFNISPNPSNGILNIIYDTKENCKLNLYNVNGKLIASISLFHYFKNRLLNVSDLAAGVYLATVTCKAERIWSAKVIVQR